MRTKTRKWRQEHAGILNKAVFLKFDQIHKAVALVHNRHKSCVNTDSPPPRVAIDQLCHCPLSSRADADVRARAVTERASWAVMAIGRARSALHQTKPLDSETHHPSLQFDFAFELPCPMQLPQKLRLKTDFFGSMANAKQFQLFLHGSNTQIETMRNTNPWHSKRRGALQGVRTLGT